MTPEQKQRIGQIRERQEHNKSAASDNPIPKFLATAYNDIDFLLSLVKSQEAGDDPEIERIAIAGIQEALRQRDELAANRMRSACVEKVKAIAESWAKSIEDQWDDRPDLSFDAAERLKAAGEIVSALESLSIEKQKE